MTEQQTQSTPLCVNPDCLKPLTLDKRRGTYKVRHGWCEACYSRWRRRGKPEGWPYAPQPQPSRGNGWPENAKTVSLEARRRNIADKCEDAFWLLETGVSIEEAAQRVNLSSRTLRRHLDLL